MDNFINFVSDNYVWFLVISIFLIFALIGYIYDSKRDKNLKNKNDIPMETVEIEIPEDTSINDAINNNMAMNIDNSNEIETNIEKLN